MRGVLKDMTVGIFWNTITGMASVLLRKSIVVVLAHRTVNGLVIRIMIQRTIDMASVILIAIRNSRQGRRKASRNSQQMGYVRVGEAHDVVEVVDIA